MPKVQVSNYKIVKNIMENICKNIGIVSEKLNDCAVKSENLRKPGAMPRLVAVSKFKPKEYIIEAYSSGQRHFGENYIQEIVDKAADQELMEKCPDIRWHMIGHVQRNKISKLLAVLPNLFVVETIDSEKLAQSFNEALVKREYEGNLNIMVQVNTSGEDSKSGTSPESCINLVKFIKEKCSKLNFIGLMTIGNIEAIHYDASADFTLLAKLREQLCEEFKLSPFDIELSMGMSADFEKAILMGSTNVRIGSTIFGSR